jgi:ubiquinone biosynthesis monooxygenase Coq7
MTNKPNLSPLDGIIAQFDQALRTCVSGANQASRSTPAEAHKEQELSGSEKKHIAGLMRINHTGEVCAQALYAGQALTAKSHETIASMKHAAAEEVDHLTWCDERLTQLGSRPSLLNPIFYGLSFALGATAGLAGDKWSLGFVAETERQVEKHLQNHLDEIPESDQKTKAIIKQMIIDEQQHGESAKAAGGKNLPNPIQLAMKTMARVMKKATYRV